MSTAEILPPPNREEYPEPNPKALLQADADALFNERAKHILPTRLGRLVVGPRDLSDRLPEDATLLDRYIIPSDESRTEEALHRFSGMVSNLKETAEKFDLIVEQDKLDSYSNILIATPHTTMSDILGMAYLSYFTSLGKDRAAKDNHMYLSRLLGYAEQRRLRKQPINLVDSYIAPVTNIVQVFPETKSLEKLREKHKDTVDGANRRASLAARRRLEDKQDSGKQQLIFIAPTGSQMKGYKKGKKNEPISTNTMKLMYASYENNTPVVIAGFELNILRSVLKVFGKPPMITGYERTIVPGGNLSYEEFETEVKGRLLSVARQVSKKRIYA